MINLNEKPKFYETNWFMWLTLILFAPVGIALMWKYKRFPDKTRKILTAVFSVYFIAMIMYINSPGQVQQRQSEAQLQAQKIADDNAAKAKADADKKVKAEADQKKLDDQKKAEADKMKSDVVYFAQVKGKEILKDRFTSAELADGGVIIHFKLSENITMKLTGDGAFQDSSKLLEAFKGRTDYTDISCQGTFPLKDSYGNKSEGNIFILGLDRTTIDKITFANINPVKDLYTLASIHIIRPELLN